MNNNNNDHLVDCVMLAPFYTDPDEKDIVKEGDIERMADELAEEFDRRLREEINSLNKESLDET